MGKNKNRWVHCPECGRNKLHRAKGLCGPCYASQYGKAHRGERAEYLRQWRKANPDKVREQDRRQREVHREERAEYGRRYCAAHREERAEYSRQYLQSHPGYISRWNAANPDKVREKDHRRYARKNGATIGPVDEAAIYERDKVCIYCGSGEDLTLDHLIPLARGGPHRQDNLAVACRSCNSRKHTKTYEEFINATTQRGKQEDNQREYRRANEVGQIHPCPMYCHRIQESWQVSA